MKNLCLNCNVELQNKWSLKFCSRSCAAIHNNKIRKKINYCKNCGIQCNNLYCSVKCQQSLKYKLYIEGWLSGSIEVDENQLNIPDAIRRYLFEKYEYKCACCGWDKINPVTNKCPLEVEHIDGNSKNNRPENLTLLCPNCHSLTPTYKALNKGNGRYSRRKRYKEGKSY